MKQLPLVPGKLTELVVGEFEHSGAVTRRNGEFAAAARD